MVVLRKLALFLVVLSSPLSLMSCNAPPEEIRIGVITYTPDPDTAHTSTGTMNAVKLVEEDLKARGPLLLGDKRYKIVFRLATVPRQPSEAVAAAQRLIRQQQVLAIVGPQFSNDAIPAGRTAEESGIPMICPVATHPDVTAGRQFVFRMSFLDQLQARALADFARQELQAESAAVLYDITDTYSRGLAEGFRDNFLARQGRSVAMLQHTPGDSSFDRLLAPLTETPPDVLFLPAYNVTARLQGESARRVGLKATLLGSDGWDQAGLAANPAFEGAYMAAHWANDFDRPEARAFSLRYLKEFKQAPNDSAALTYDALNLLIAALESIGHPDPKVLRRALIDLPPYAGVSGETDFIDHGDPAKGVFILRFQNGQYGFHKLVQPVVNP